MFLFVGGGKVEYHIAIRERKWGGKAEYHVAIRERAAARGTVFLVVGGRAEYLVRTLTQKDQQV